MWGFIHFQEGGHGLLHEQLSADRRNAVLPQQFGNIPISVASFALGEDEFLAIPHTQDFWSFPLARSPHALDRQTKPFCSTDEIVVGLDEYGAS